MSEVDIGQLGEGEGRPEKVEWCGDNALVLAWGGKVMVVGPGGNSLRYVNPLLFGGTGGRADGSYDYAPSAILVGEVDGLRIISSSSCDFLQKVPGTFVHQFITDIRLFTGCLQPWLIASRLSPL